MFMPSTCEWSSRCDGFSVGVWWKEFKKSLQPDDRTPIAVEIIGQVDLTKVSKQ